MPPATPPAIAAVFDFEAGVGVWVADWPSIVTVGTLLGTKVGVAKPSELLLEVGIMLGIEAMENGALDNGTQLFDTIMDAIPVREPGVISCLGQP